MPFLLDWEWAQVGLGLMGVDAQVKVLKALVEKEADSSGLVLSEIPLHMMQGHRRVSGTTANLHQLLLRLNMSDWWTKSDTARTT